MDTATERAQQLHKGGTRNTQIAELAQKYQQLSTKVKVGNQARANINKIHSSISKILNFYRKSTQFSVLNTLLQIDLYRPLHLLVLDI